MYYIYYLTYTAYLFSYYMYIYLFSIVSDFDHVFNLYTYMVHYNSLQINKMDIL